MDVLPEPLGPIRARISPGAAAPDTPLRMVLIVVTPFFFGSLPGLGAAMLPRMRPLCERGVQMIRNLLILPNFNYSQIVRVPWWAHLLASFTSTSLVIRHHLKCFPPLVRIGVVVLDFIVASSIRPPFSRSFGSDCSDGMIDSGVGGMASAWTQTTTYQFDGRWRLWFERLNGLIGLNWDDSGFIEWPRSLKRWYDADARCVFCLLRVPWAVFSWWPRRYEGILLTQWTLWPPGIFIFALRCSLDIESSL